MNRHTLYFFGAMCIFFVSCNDSASSGEKGEDSTGNTSAPASVKEENISYSSDTLTFNGMIAYKDSGGKKPGVLVVHEWWGNNDYSKNRARQLADLGYVAMAVDMFGNGKTATTPNEAMKLAGPFYNDPTLTKKRLDAALANLKANPNVDSSRIAAIGFCYGGYVVLNAAKLGADLDGVVSFHGGLGGVPPQKDKLKSKILVLHGEADSMVPAGELATFKKQMDSVGADYTFKSYPGAKHAFTNPASTENGKKLELDIAYDPAADSASWNEMKAFLSRVLR